jgi:DNA-3-methyladenine glycosylase II
MHEKHHLAVRHLSKHDPVLRSVIRRAGPFKLRLERNRFRMLVRSIASQQLSTAAARTIMARVESLAGPGQMTAADIARLTPAQLRSAGLSAQKVNYLQELTAAVIDGRLPLGRLGRADDETVIGELTAIKGIGRWTAQMFLIFSLGRLDVFPHDDLGVRAAIRDLYGLAELPDKSASHEIAAAWRPYASVGSWYCWRSIDLRRAAAAQDATSSPRAPKRPSVRKQL